MIPGEMFIKDGEIELNAGRKTVTLTVTNTGDRPIQVGSHYHFFETNPALKFDRKEARGMRLNIAAGTAVRFEPGQTRDVTLVALAGKRTVYGFRQDVMGKLVIGRHRRFACDAHRRPGSPPGRRRARRLRARRARQPVHIMTSRSARHSGRRNASSGVSIGAINGACDRRRSHPARPARRARGVLGRLDRVVSLPIDLLPLGLPSSIGRLFLSATGRSTRRGSDYVGLPSLDEFLRHCVRSRRRWSATSRSSTIAKSPT